VFFAYVLFEVVQFCVLFAMCRLSSVTVSTYQGVDLLGRAGSIAFRFGIIQEILQAPVAHDPSLRRATAWILRCTAAFLALLAALFIGSVYSWNFSQMVFPAYAVRHILDLVQCALLALIFLWHRFLRLRMQDFVVGVALGLGLVAGLEPLLDALKDFRAVDSQVVDLLQLGTYHVAVLIWLFFARVQEEFTSCADVGSLSDARKWAVELGRVRWQ